MNPFCVKESPVSPLQVSLDEEGGGADIHIDGDLIASLGKEGFRFYKPEPSTRKALEARGVATDANGFIAIIK